jgi:ABC-type dipeptide/oligopeptide/nickel transport system permease component
MRADYIRTARAKGLPSRRVILVHALRNALVPTVSVLGISAAFLLTGAVTVETVFSWPGVGSYLVDASTSLDYPAVIGTTLMIAFVFMASSLIVDILYGVLDPQIREV